jgi:hypothetical protein
MYENVSNSFRTEYIPKYTLAFVSGPFDVITSLVSLVYWGFRGEKVTSQGDA